MLATMAKTTESAQLRYVAQLAEQYGLLMHHCRDSRHCSGDAGFPDLVLLGPGGILFPELKSSGYRTPGQTTWRWALQAAGLSSPLWYPGDERDGLVAQQIAALARA